MLCRFLLLCLAVASGCESNLYQSEDATPHWIEYELRDGPPRRDLFQICHLALVRSGFPPGDSDEASGRVTSGWDVSLAPYSFRGTRQQGIVEIAPGAQHNDWRLRVRVRKEINLEQRDTLSMRAARWDPGADDVQRARTVLQHIRSQVMPAGG